MADLPPKVEFALGSEVSPGHFFKSNFARSFAGVGGSSRIADTKSLDYDFFEGNATIVEEPPDSPSQQNTFFSLINFDKETERPNSSAWASDSNTKRSNPSNVEVASADLSELEKLRKISTKTRKVSSKCQSLTEENERLQSVATALSEPVQVIDTVYLQNQVSTLEWQLKQSETSRQMYRSLMEQVVRFLDRARKSLDLIHERSNPKSSSAKDKLRVPRSRSVHTVHGDSAGASSCASSTTSSASSSSSSSSSSSLSSSRFSRAKSVAQISSSNGPMKDLTWSVLRRNDPAHGTPPRTDCKDTQQVAAVSAQDVSNVPESVGLYRRPKQMELDPDDKPPEKLSQEAFRLMRTVQSLLVMREPDLARVNANQDSPLLDQHPVVTALASPHANFANSTTLQDGAAATDERAIYKTSANGSLQTSSQTMLMSPGTRQSIDSASSKITEDEDRASNFNGLPKQENGQQKQPSNGYYHAVPLSSTPNSRRFKKTDRKDQQLKTLRDWALGNSNAQVSKSRPKPATSVSSAEDESGFSSMSSFQEVGLPQISVPNTLSPIKGGCHTEVGLPEVPIEKIRHRRWSSTPTDFHALFKRHSGSFANGTPNTTESLSVWV